MASSLFFIAGAVVPIGLFLRSNQLFRRCLARDSVLDSTPQQLSNTSVVALFLLVLIKYPIRAVGELFRVFPVLKLEPSGQIYHLPRCSVVSVLTVSDDDLRKYYRAVSKDTDRSISHENNPLFLLVPLTNPLLLHLLVKYVNPILPLGSVNVRNRFEFLDPEACRHLQSSKWGAIRASATMGGSDAPGRRVKRGIEFDVTVEVIADEKPIFRQIFTVLQFMRSSTKSAVAVSANREVAEPVFEGDELGMKIDFNAPSRWAALCKDYNPIHVSPIAALLFGFPGKIAHGNLAAGMVLARALTTDRDSNSVLGNLVQILETERKASYLEVDFRRPIVVPLDINVKSLTVPNGSSGKMGFQIVSLNKRREEKVHVEGRFGLL